MDRGTKKRKEKKKRKKKEKAFYPLALEFGFGDAQGG
jgi:hypothetical protein